MSKVYYKVFVRVDCSYIWTSVYPSLISAKTAKTSGIPSRVTSSPNSILVASSRPVSTSFPCNY